MDTQTYMGNIIQWKMVQEGGDFQRKLTHRREQNLKFWYEVILICDWKTLSQEGI